MDRKIKAKIIDEVGLRRTVTRLAHEILERNRGAENLVIVGVRTRGVYLAQRIIHEIEKIEGKKLPLGILDITMYRDDFRQRLKQPVVQQTDIPFDIYDKDVILVDDVLYTGRTTRAALEALMSFGRPARIQLAVLVDRGHRELPIKPDYVGKNIPTSIGEEVQVKMQEIDGEDSVLLVETPPEADAA
ncbi:MAG: bifunctional pyr operon transcriptional regulator/uracil phosphoribosyltransferase PyrR [candidate division KSB1 bacterium]|nr:bifunctional pyr operon transcriptional regulator/uracil phosphoribosyltransferase PyrR [candidate division KSB1 bacterium]MDZ7319453.1 bifunctional pyr operon transcriptional regulator/uracil phosphoribosyltransferase PyrR [candidate division KSB1 bacterium]MDZ7340556.1 bifunctional pyr operon transcriptional regulator/uracil phosphoribosyltransferase PyrR [candidate division KSB1 bacterium]